MKAVARKGDTISTGHPCNSTTKCGSSKSSVTINSLEVHYVKGKTETHLWRVGDKCPPHTASLNSTGTKVFVEGAQIAKVGDSYKQCGTISKGSPNVFVT